MKLEFKGNTLVVTREDVDPKYYGTVNAAGESKLLHAVKTELNNQGYDLIKTRMWKDGHLVDEMQQYLRTRKKGAGKEDIYIHNASWNVAGANDYFNEGEVVLTVTRDVFNS